MFSGITALSTHCDNTASEMLNECCMLVRADDDVLVPKDIFELCGICTFCFRFPSAKAQKSDRDLDVKQLVEQIILGELRTGDMLWPTASTLLVNVMLSWPLYRICSCGVLYLTSSHGPL